jgi:hypothetical protein
MRKWSLISGGLAALALALSLGAQALRSRILASPRRPEATLDTGTPKVVLQETKHDFGVLDPREPCRHLFILRNEGTAPLKIAKAGTSCKCTVSVLPKGEIPPGKGGPIEIESKTEGISGKFRHTADFATNDPAMPRIQLAIEGDIRSYLSASDPALRLPDLERGRPVQASTVIFSQVWDTFSLREVKSSIEGLTWDFQPAPPERLKDLDARSGYVATFRLPGSAISKSFHGWVEAVAEGADQPQNTKTVQVAIAGEVPGLRAVYGPLIDDEGVVTIGAMKPGEGSVARLVLRVRGDHREIQVQKIEKSPSFLNVSVSPQTPELAKKGVYTIVVEVPPDAPTCNYMVPGNMGDVRVWTDHPEMPEIVRLKIAFAVTGGRLPRGPTDRPKPR